jgi:uncharacterized protein YjbI with pentapeptide repeats
MAKTPRRTARKPAVDWVAVLRSGPAGVRRWNRLTAAERKKVSLAGADLSRCDLTRLNLRAARAEKASFAGAVLAWARLTDGSFAGADFTGATLTGADLQHGDFRGASLTGADVTQALAQGADLRGADLSGANLRRSYFTTARFDGATKWPADVVIPPEMARVGRVYDPLLTFADPGDG